jgi:hypothetical protein
MEAANNTIPKGLEDASTPFSNIYLAGQNALALKLTMDLARISIFQRTSNFRRKSRIRRQFRSWPPSRVDQMSKKVWFKTRENGLQGLEDAS